MLLVKTTTAVSREAFVRAFYRAWKYTQGRPSYLAAAILFGQYAFETGWGKFCYCFNLGNIRATKGWIAAGGGYFELPGAWEIVNGQRVIAGGYFRGFEQPKTGPEESLDQGMEDHLAFLSTLDRYAPAFEVLQEAASQPFTKENCLKYGALFVRKLKEGGYFTGDLTNYMNGVVSIAQGILDLKSILDDELPDTLPEVKPQQLGPDTEFIGWGATSVQDVIGRWTYDECMTVEFLACRWDAEEAA